MKFLKNLDNIITILLVIVIILLLIAIYRKYQKKEAEKKLDTIVKKATSDKVKQDLLKTALSVPLPPEPKEYYGTAQQLAGLDVFSGKGSFADYRPEQGMFARDPIDVAVRKDIAGGSGYATSGSDIFLDPSKFTVYAPSDSNLYGTY